MINTHPGLLPATKGTYGINTQQFRIDNLTMNTLAKHYVVGEKKYDEGPNYSRTQGQD